MAREFDLQRGRPDGDHCPFAAHSSSEAHTKYVPGPIRNLVTVNAPEPSGTMFVALQHPFASPIESATTSPGLKWVPLTV